VPSLPWPFRKGVVAGISRIVPVKTVSLLWRCDVTAELMGCSFQSQQLEGPWLPSTTSLADEAQRLGLLLVCCSETSWVS